MSEEFLASLMLFVIAGVTAFGLFSFYWFHQRPFSGSMLAALQLLVLGGAHAALSSLEAKVKIAAVEGSLSVGKGGCHEVTFVSMLIAAVIVFSISAWLQRDKDKDVFRRYGDVR
jgi:hypothetical protein